MSRKEHWETVYACSDPCQVGWYRLHLEKSLQLIDEIGLKDDASIIDVGGGCSTLADDLLDRGFNNISVLDISRQAIERAKERLGDLSDKINWIEADITDLSIGTSQYDLWHDRAVFHFLTSADDRRAYIRVAFQSLKPGGHLIIATFSPEAPPKCSGLDVVRYTPATLKNEMGRGFRFVKNVEQEHHTPSGVRQPYIYCYFQRNANTQDVV